jgi:AsmA-like C-terminal region
VADQAVQFQNVKASGLDGEVAMEGTYSTLEGRENPEISFVYDAKGIDIQKAFFAFNTARKILPVAKFMSGNINAHMSLDGRLNEDMTTSLATLQGSGTIELLTGSMKDFGPLDKLSQSLDIAGMKDIPLKDVKTDFSFKAGKVVVNPFLVHANELDMLVGGSHGFDQSLDYDVTLKLPRSQLGSKGTSFVKNVVETAAGKGIPVKLDDAVTMNVKMCGTINSPDVNADMNRVVSNAESDLNREVNDFVNAKLDSARHQLQNPPASKKPLYVQANYKPKSAVKSKKKYSTTHKKKAHTKTTKKKKKTTRHYTASLKKETSTASNGRKHTER